MMCVNTNQDIVIYELQKGDNSFNPTPPECDQGMLRKRVDDCEDDES